MRYLSSKRKFYEHVAKNKGDMDEYWATGFSQSLLIEKTKKILNDVHNKRIIDIGCGDGRSVLYLMERKNAVVGIDISYTRLSRAKKKVKKHASRIFFVQSYAEVLPIKREMFNGAICTEVLEHVINDDALLRELSRILEPHAWVLISIPTVSLRRYFDMRYLKKPIYLDPVEHVREYTYYRIPSLAHDFVLIKDLKKKLSIYGLTILKRYGIGFLLPLWISKFKLGQFIENIVMMKGVNKFIATLPILQNFVVYTMFLLKKRV